MYCAPNSGYYICGYINSSAMSISSCRTMRESNAYVNTGDTVPADSLPAPEANIAQQLKLKPKETLTCLDRGDTLSPLQIRLAIRGCDHNCVTANICTCFWCSLSSRGSFPLQTGNTMSAPQKNRYQREEGKEAHTHPSLKY